MTVNRHWYSDTNVYLRVQSLYWVHESFHRKIHHAMIEFSLSWIFIIVIKFTIIAVGISDGRQWLTANSWRTFADHCLAFFHRLPPAISSLIPRLSKKLLPIYERDIGQAAGSLISRQSSPLLAMNAITHRRHAYNFNCDRQLLLSSLSLLS